MQIPMRQVAFLIRLQDDVMSNISKMLGGFKLRGSWTSYCHFMVRHDASTGLRLPIVP